MPEIKSQYILRDVIRPALEAVYIEYLKRSTRFDDLKEEEKEEFLNGEKGPSSVNFLAVFGHGATRDRELTDLLFPTENKKLTAFENRQFSLKNHPLFGRHDEQLKKILLKAVNKYFDDFSDDGHRFLGRDVRESLKDLKEDKHFQAQFYKEYGEELENDFKNFYSANRKIEDEGAIVEVDREKKIEILKNFYIENDNLSEEQARIEANENVDSYELRKIEINGELKYVLRGAVGEDMNLTESMMRPAGETLPQEATSRPEQNVPIAEKASETNDLISSQADIGDKQEGKTLQAKDVDSGQARMTSEEAKDDQSLVVDSEKKEGDEQLAISDKQEGKTLQAKDLDSGQAGMTLGKKPITEDADVQKVKQEMEGSNISPFLDQNLNAKKNENVDNLGENNRENQIENILSLMNASKRSNSDNDFNNGGEENLKKLFASQIQDSENNLINTETARYVERPAKYTQEELDEDSGEEVLRMSGGRPVKLIAANGEGATEASLNDSPDNSRNKGGLLSHMNPFAKKPRMPKSNMKNNINGSLGSSGNKESSSFVTSFVKKVFLGVAGVGGSLGGGIAMGFFNNN